MRKEGDMVPVVVTNNHSRAVAAVCSAAASGGDNMRELMDASRVFLQRIPYYIIPTGRNEEDYEMIVVIREAVSERGWLGREKLKTHKRRMPLSEGIKKLLPPYSKVIGIQVDFYNRYLRVYYVKDEPKTE